MRDCTQHPIILNHLICVITVQKKFHPPSYNNSISSDMGSSKSSGTTNSPSHNPIGRGGSRGRPSNLNSMSGFLFRVTMNVSPSSTRFMQAAKSCSKSHTSTRDILFFANCQSLARSYLLGSFRRYHVSSCKAKFVLRVKNSSMVIRSTGASGFIAVSASPAIAQPI